MDAKLEAITRLHSLLGDLIEDAPTPKSERPQLNQALQMLGSAVNISHLLLKAVVDAYESQGPSMHEAIRAVKLHVEATDAYAGEANSKEAQHVVDTILKCKGGSSD